jgi:hypothetical protein
LEVVFHRLLVKRISFPLDDLEGVLRAVAEAGPKPIAVDITDQFGLAVDNGDGAFGARRHAISAPIAELFVDLDDFSYSHF